MTLSAKSLAMVCVSLALTALLGAAAALPMPLAQNNPPQRKIALLHMYDGVSFFQRLGTLTGLNKRRYADRHGYDFVVSTPQETSGIYNKLDCNTQTALIEAGPDAAGACWGNDSNFDIDHSRAPTFGKLKLALAACQGRDDAWLLWSDADAMVVNQSTPLESIIDDAYDVMLTYDWLMLNAGVLLLKCSAWTKALLTRVYDARQFDAARALDQSSLQEHLDKLAGAERDAHVKVVPKHAMNVYLEEYRAGDFVVHMAGKLYEATEEGLFAIANQLDVLSMVDDVEDVAAFFRSRALLNYYSGVCPVKYGEKQSSCATEDPRRIFLNESLGSMSLPNRYRHVGLRYYWLTDWKDKYDVEGWNTKKKALPKISRADEERAGGGVGGKAAADVGTVQKDAERIVEEEGDAKEEADGGGGEGGGALAGVANGDSGGDGGGALAGVANGDNGGDGGGALAVVANDDGGGVGGGGQGRARGGVGGGAKGSGGRLWYVGLGAVGIGAVAVGVLRVRGSKKMGSKMQ